MNTKLRQTANLASFFTRPRFDYHGPTTMGGMKESTACTIYQSNHAMYAAYVSQVVRPDVDWSKPDASAKGSEFCVRMLREKKVNVWLEDASFLQWYLTRETGCSLTDVVMPAAISFGIWEVAFFVHDEHKELVDNLSTAVRYFRNTPEEAAFQDKYFGLGEPCPDAELADDEQITFKSMQGVFLIYLIFVVSALLLAVGQAAATKKNAEESGDGRESSEELHTEGEMLRMLLKEVAAIKGRMNPAGHADSKPAPFDRGELPPPQFQLSRLTDADGRFTSCKHNRNN